MSAITLRRSHAAHTDLMNALLIACREGVRLHSLRPEEAERFLVEASGRDCSFTRYLLEHVMRRVVGGVQ